MKRKEIQEIRDEVNKILKESNNPEVRAIIYHKDLKLEDLIKEK